MHPTWPTRRPFLRVAAASQPRIVAIGDSYIKHHHGDGYQSFNGPINIANALLGQGFAFTRAENFGNGGETAPEVAARLSQALAAGPDVLLVCAGSNDVRSGVDPAETAVALTAIAEAAAGTPTLFLTVPPRVEEQWPQLEQQAHAQATNLHLTALAERFDHVDWCDWVAPNRTTRGYTALPGMTYDGTHLSARGSYRAGVVLADCLRPRTVVPSAADEAALLTINDALRSAGGRVGDGAAGVVAEGWRLRRHEGDSSAEATMSPDGQEIALLLGPAGGSFLYEADTSVVRRSLQPGHRLRGFATVSLGASSAWDYMFLELREEGVDDNDERALYPSTPPCDRYRAIRRCG